ncbi:hypothetical protein ACLOJK_026192 [Asimina triloba]
MMDRRSTNFGAPSSPDQPSHGCRPNSECVDGRRTASLPRIRPGGQRRRSSAVAASIDLKSMADLGGVQGVRAGGDGRGSQDGGSASMATSTTANGGATGSPRWRAGGDEGQPWLPRKPISTVRSGEIRGRQRMACGGQQTHHEQLPTAKIQNPPRAAPISTARSRKPIPTAAIGGQIWAAASSSLASDQPSTTSSVDPTPRADAVHLRSSSHPSRSDGQDHLHSPDRLHSISSLKYTA